MADIYDFFSKKKVTDEKPQTFHQRYTQCLVNVETKGYCDCQMCIDKESMSKKLFNIVSYLCKDYKENTGRDMYVADALEVVLVVAARLKDYMKK